MAERKLRLEVRQSDEDGECGVSRVPRWHPSGQDSIITNDITGSVMKIMVTDSKGKLISITIDKNGTIQEVIRRTDEHNLTERLAPPNPREGTRMDLDQKNDQQDRINSEVTIDESCNFDLDLVKEEMEEEEPAGPSHQFFSDVVGVVSEGYKNSEAPGASVEDKLQPELTEIKTEDVDITGQFETVFIKPSENVSENDSPEQNSESFNFIDIGTQSVLSNCIFGSNEQGIGMPMFCRLCATQSEVMLDIFELDEVYRNIIRDFLPIQVKATDFLPKKACHPCLENLKLCNNFHRTVAEAQKQFLILEEKISSEFRTLEKYPQGLPLFNGRAKTPIETSEVSEACPEPRSPPPTTSRGPLTRGMKKKTEEVEEIPAELTPEPDIIKCRICGEFFGTPKSCFTHSEVHAMHGYFPCSMCSKILRTRKDAYNHSSDHILPLTAHKMRDLMKRKIHELKLSAVKNVKCAVDIIEENKLQQREMIENKTPDMIRCRICKALFSSPRACYKHSGVHASGNYYPCCMCDKNFTNKTEALVHSLEHLMGSETPRRRMRISKDTNRTVMVNRPVPDLDLESYLITKSGRLSNNAEKDEDRDDCDMVKCRLCGMFFGTGKSCYAHSASHNSKDYYPCSMCDETFTNHIDSFNHSIIHTMSKPPERRAEMLGTHMNCYKETLLPATRVNNTEKYIAQTDNVNMDTEEQKLADPGIPGDLVKCRFCGLMFGSVLNCYKHGRAHYSRKKYPCCLCKRTFINQGECYVHSLSHQMGTVNQTSSAEQRRGSSDKDDINQVLIKCRVCKMLFASAVKFHSHCYSHISGNHFPCCICNETFKTEADYCSHSIKHIGNSSEDQRISIPICNVCGERFPTDDRLRFHKMYHDAKAKRFYCEKCHKLFTSESSLYEHLRSVHIKANDEFNCKRCSQQFGNKQDLNAHKLTHKKTLIECAACNSKFYTVERLKTHKLLSCRFTTTVKHHACSYCGKTFLRKQSLIIHKQSHASDKAYSAGTQSRQARDKQRESHRAKEEFKCSRCGASFSNSVRLREHEALHEENATFDCYQCDKSFKSEEIRSEHVRCVHTNKPHECDICGERFSHLNSMERHKRVWHSHKTIINLA